MAARDPLDRYNDEARAIRDAINRRPLTEFYPLEKSRNGMYKCPICGSGTHANGTGALSISKGARPRVTCFSGGSHGTGGACFGEKGQDTLGALRILLGNKTEKEIFAYCGYEMGEDPQQAPRPAPLPAAEPQPEKVEEPAKDFKAEIAQYIAALKGSKGESYLQDSRNFTPETIHHFNLGYDGQRDCIVIPYNPQGTYYSRRFLPDAPRPAYKGKYDKLPRAAAGAEPLFNPGELYHSDVVFVTEGAFDAISLYQAGGKAVALNGLAFSKLVEQLKRKPTKAAIVLCLDNDAEGRHSAPITGEALEEIGVFCINGIAAIMGETTDPQAPEYRKDPNEVLAKDGTEALRQAVEKTAAEAREQHRMTILEAETDQGQGTEADAIDEFLKVIQTRKYEPMPTGITDIDKAIGGGFIRQWLVLLGAAPGVGKTALAQWIFEGMAKRGTPCIFINLEMSREQIIARSFSRMANRNGHKINATTILQGYKWTEEQRAAVMEAAAEYKAEIAPRMTYNPDDIGKDLDSILAYVEKEAKQIETAGQPTPCIVLDYLQIITGRKGEDAAEIIKRAVGDLKDFAIRHNTVVFVIMAHNRKSNESGKASMESGRDTSAIEYSADLQLALTHTQCLDRKGQTKKRPEDLTPAERRKITLVIVKSRFGGVTTEVDLDFDGNTMTLTQCQPFDPFNTNSPYNAARR